MVGGEDTVHMGEAFFDPLHHMGLSGHTAAQKYLLGRMTTLGMGQRAQVAKDPLLRMFPDSAGVHDHHVSALCGVGDPVSAFA